MEKFDKPNFDVRLMKVIDTYVEEGFPRDIVERAAIKSEKVAMQLIDDYADWFKDPDNHEDHLAGMMLVAGMKDFADGQWPRIRLMFHCLRLIFRADYQATPEKGKVI